MLNKKEIIAWLNKMEIQNYTINDDLTVDVDGDVDIEHKNLKSIPVKFNKVEGNFICSNNQLTTLNGVPNEVAGKFEWYNNDLDNFDNLPSMVNGKPYEFIMDSCNG